MNNIYELLNNAEIDLDDYNGEKLSDLESQKAKKQITKELKKMKKRTIRRLHTSVAVAGLCVILGAGGISVAAATNILPITEVIKELFGIDSEEEKQVLSDMGANLNESDECQGYKITVESVVNDEKHIAVIYRIEKADGSNLYEDEICTDVRFWDRKLNVSTYGGSSGGLEQNLNKKMIRFFDECYLGESIEDKEQIMVELNDMKLFFEKREVEIKGNWKFVLPVQKIDYSIKLAENQEIVYEDICARIEELTISPIGYSIELRLVGDYEDKRKIIRYLGKTGTLTLRLKNGDEVDLGGASGPTCNEDGSWTFHLINTFDELILREDMEKIVIGNKEFSL